MKYVKIISRIATFSAIASFIFTVISALTTYFILTMSVQGAPIEYIAFYILSSVLPYLFIAVLSLIIAVMSKATEEENVQEEALPPVEPADDNA